ncbi:hypothetical protein [Halpernia sp. GG3]
MKQENDAWWKERFKALEQYLRCDADRFRSAVFSGSGEMPMSGTQGVVGYFYPAVPASNGRILNGRQHRFSTSTGIASPSINEDILWNHFWTGKTRCCRAFLNVQPF